LWEPDPKAFAEQTTTNMNVSAIPAAETASATAQWLESLFRELEDAAPPLNGGAKAIEGHVVEPGTDNAFALVLPHANTAAMQVFLHRFSETLAGDEHAAMVLDQAGWHGSKALAVPANITLVPLPSYSPELNPVERVWLYLKERFLSHRLLADYEAIVDAACNAWNRLVAQAGRIKSLCSYPWILQVNAYARRYHSPRNCPDQRPRFRHFPLSGIQHFHWLRPSRDAG
jgi:DDE superfamily endonuclease